jgi:hypothetical protein
LGETSRQICQAIIVTQAISESGFRAIGGFGAFFIYPTKSAESLAFTTDALNSFSLDFFLREGFIHRLGR